MQTSGAQPSLHGSMHDCLPIGALVEVIRYIYSNTTVKTLLNVRGVLGEQLPTHLSGGLLSLPVDCLIFHYPP